MTIHDLGPLKALYRAEQAQTESAQQENGTPAADASTKTDFSRLARSEQNDVDVARVAELKEAIQEGRLEVDSDKIADALIASVQELITDGESR